MMSFFRTVGSILAEMVVNTFTGGGGQNCSDDDDSSGTYAFRNSGDYNPATGLPTIGGPGTMDVAGNDYGSSSGHYSGGSMFNDD